MYKIEIHAVLNGWCVNVGCQTVVFDDLDKMMNELKNYFLDPREREVFWRKHSINSKYTLDVPHAAVGYPPQNYGGGGAGGVTLTDGNSSA